MDQPSYCTNLFCFCLLLLFTFYTLCGCFVSTLSGLVQVVLGQSQACESHVELGLIYANLSRARYVSHYPRFDPTQVWAQAKLGWACFFLLSKILKCFLEILKYPQKIRIKTIAKIEVYIREFSGPMGHADMLCSCHSA